MNPYDPPLNPYDPPARETISENFRAKFADPIPWIVSTALYFPVILIAAFYGTWGLATLVLGHRPRPWIDDPRQIGIVVDVAYLLSGAVFVAFPAVTLVGVLTQLFDRRWSRKMRVVRAALLASLFVATIKFVRWDPLLVFKWYMD